MPRGPVRKPARGPQATTNDFGAFVATPRTVWRPALTKFEPRWTISEDVQGALRKIERLDHELSRHPRLEGGLIQRIRHETLARNAFATASIEGNPLTLAEVESLLKGPASPADANGPDEIEILNYASFMTSPAALRAPRTPAEVLAVHAALFRGVLKDAGGWKTRPNFIGSARDRQVVYVPTIPERVESELQNGLEWLHGARHEHPILRAAIFHHEFESVHPFRDGNGRTGRALTPMILHDFGYKSVSLAPIDHAIHKTRGLYYEALAVVEQNGFEDHTPWVEYIVPTFLEAYEEAVERALFQRRLPADLSAREREVAAWFAHLRQDDARKRVKFNDVHNAFPNVPERTLKRDLSRLRDEGVLDVQGTLKGTTYRLAGRVARDTS